MGREMLKRVVFYLGAAVLLSACSAMLDVEYDSVEHACAPSGVKCLPGYHCRVRGTSYCVPDHAVPEFGECRDDLDCDSAQKCIDFHCMRPCTALAALTDCPSGHYCHPYRNRAPTYVGGCKPVDSCQIGQIGDCGNGNKCIELQRTPSIATCFPACSVTLSNSPGLDCSSATTFRCQIAGLDKIAVCMESIGTPPCTSGTCNTVSKPCPNGQIVYNGVCRAWCEPPDGLTPACPIDTVCCDSVVDDDARTPSGKLGLCLPEVNCLN